MKVNEVGCQTESEVFKCLGFLKYYFYTGGWKGYML